MNAINLCLYICISYIPFLLREMKFWCGGSINAGEFFYFIAVSPRAIVHSGNSGSSSQISISHSYEIHT